MSDAPPSRGSHGSEPRVGSGDGDGSSRRWLILFIGLLAMTAGCTFQYGLAYLIPALRHEGFSLELASTLVACPTAGLLLTLIGWGAAADRWGERIVLASGLGLAGVILQLASSVHGAAGLGICLALAGAAGGSVFAASGRLILGWFATHERGLAMGIRQSAQPLGVALAAVTLPALGASGTWLPLRILGGFCLVAAALVVWLVRDPARAQPSTVPAGTPHRRASPYRQPILWRIHAASALLVVPQFAVATFALVFLVDARGWDATAAGQLLAVAQLCGAASRLGAGYWSDRAGSRMRPMRILAVSTGAGLLALAVAAAAGSSLAVPVLLACAVVSVSTNGLAFTAVAEYAGPAWAGRALGIQNTGQNALAAATPPVLALAIGSIGFGASFAVVGAFPVVAAVLVPVGAERTLAGGGRSRRDRAPDAPAAPEPPEAPA
ncbi:MAG TPA: MFS transporter [Streptosporangiaceae bacterium]|nr:MFS transporter [Streptosporangiaceae bacterium]